MAHARGPLGGGKTLPGTSVRQPAQGVGYATEETQLAQSATLWQKGIIHNGWPSFKVQGVCVCVCVCVCACVRACVCVCSSVWYGVLIRTCGGLYMQNVFVLCMCSSVY